MGRARKRLLEKIAQFIPSFWFFYVVRSIENHERMVSVRELDDQSVSVDGSGPAE
jgi:hypothetical protein